MSTSVLILRQFQEHIWDEMRFRDKVTFDFVAIETEIGFFRVIKCRWENTKPILTGSELESLLIMHLRFPNAETPKETLASGDGLGSVQS